MATIVKCTDCGVRLRRQTPFDLCDTCQAARVLYGDDIGKPLPPVEEETPRLKLFKVTIPSQTIPNPPHHSLDRDLVGYVTDGGFVQGREIIVLGESYSKLWNQVLGELGCEAQQVDLKIEEIKGPFKHGYLIAYNEPNGF